MLPRAAERRRRAPQRCRVAFDGIDGHAPRQREHAEAERDECERAERVLRRRASPPEPDRDEGTDTGRREIAGDSRERNTAAPERVTPGREAAEIRALPGAQPRDDVQA